MPKKAVKKPKVKSPLSAWDADTLHLAEQVGEFIEYWGFKKIHGQIWTLIFISKNPVDSTSMVRALKVSKALVSLAIKDLLYYQVIELAGKGKKRTVFFRSTNDLQGVIVQVLKKREKVLLEQTKSSIEKLGQNVDETSPVSEVRLHELKDMVWAAQDFLEVLINTNLEPSIEN
jgi:DNA-binding transcriptional regulator GbsR (MarR family)